MPNRHGADQSADLEQPKGLGKGKRPLAELTGDHDVVPPPPSTGRITVALAKKVVEDLEQAQRDTGYSKTDLVNRAISLFAFVAGEIDEGAEFYLRRKDGTQYLIKSY